MHVGFYQFAPRFGEVSHNLDKVLETLDRAMRVRLSVRVAARSNQAVGVSAGWTDHTAVDRRG
jgi:hypothetical protein